MVDQPAARHPRPDLPETLAREAPLGPEQAAARRPTSRRRNSQYICGPLIQLAALQVKDPLATNETHHRGSHPSTAAQVREMPLPQHESELTHQLALLLRQLTNLHLGGHLAQPRADLASASIHPRALSWVAMALHTSAQQRDGLSEETARPGGLGFAAGARQPLQARAALAGGAGAEPVRPKCPRSLWDGLVSRRGH